MCERWCAAMLAPLLLLCATHGGLCGLCGFCGAEETVPVQLSGGGRLWKRSEAAPSFRIAAFGHNFTLNLRPDDSFVSPVLKIQRVKAKRFPGPFGAEHVKSEADLLETTDWTEEGDTGLRTCFYSGTVDFKPDSVVAVSLCRGIQGSFITEGDEYLIQPKQPGRGKSQHTQVHVVRRRVFSGGTSSELKARRSRHQAQLVPDVPGAARKKRFVSAPRYIETLVVADFSMAQFYGDDVKHYLLTLVAVAAQIYKHPSIKNSINMVVVKMLVVEDEEVGPSVSNNGGVTLRNFCAWQQLFNPPSQRHPEHYDTALLFTRKDICGHQSCDTLGVADVGTMCDPKRSCSVIEDNGLQAAFTAAHELGHVLSMPHDDSKNCESLFGHLDQHHMMAPLFVQLNQTLPWSPCSALYVTEFFDNGHGDCLLDTPERTLPLPTELPGASYDLDRQCQQSFGEEFAHCPNTTAADICSQLWCREWGQPHCTTRNGSLLWADGTPCGNGHVCLNGACATVGKVTEPKVVVDGSWGAWGPWGQCSRTCGGGVKFSRRECTAPEPQNGGKYCEGQRVKYQSCNTQPCEGSNGKSFREEQCEKYNSLNHLDIHGNTKEWIPKYAGVSPRDRCKLFCRAKGSSEFKVFESKVIDGTTCGPDTTSICVQGQCVKAGCDLEIGSSAKLDKCGVCGGNGSSCRKISGSLNRAVYGYSDIVTIPAGATNIDMKQRSHRGVKHDGHYLAIQAEDGTYILNGNFSVSTVEQDIPVRGALLRYSGSSTPLERIQSFQQLQESITIQLLATAGEASPPKVKYTFFLPKDVSFSRAKERKGSLHMIQPFGVPQWVLGEWSECSKTCGSGWSRRTVECRDSNGFLSDLCDKDLRPMDIQACADLPCPVWQMGPWSSCSRTCGVGARHRSVFCTDYLGKTVDPEWCDPVRRPEPVLGECIIYDEC
ncbi:A disintegrin and metalloproteinase with thrombospondin motifs 8 [Arapaima gigas]